MVFIDLIILQQQFQLYYFRYLYLAKSKLFKDRKKYLLDDDSLNGGVFILRNKSYNF